MHRQMSLFLALIGLLFLAGCGGTTPALGVPSTPTPTAQRTPVPDTPVLSEFVLPHSDSAPLLITLGPDGNLWFTEDAGNRIGRITPDEQVTEFPLSAGDSKPDAITSGSDGNLWFTEFGRGQVGRITLAGQITYLPLPADELTTGPDGSLWFADQESNQIGQLPPAGQVTEFPLAQDASDPGPLTTGPDGNLWFTELGSERRPLRNMSFKNKGERPPALSRLLPLHCLRLIRERLLSAL